MANQTTLGSGLGGLFKTLAAGPAIRAQAQDARMKNLLSQAFLGGKAQGQAIENRLNRGRLEAIGRLGEDFANAGILPQGVNPYAVADIARAGKDLSLSELGGFAGDVQNQARRNQAVLDYQLGNTGLANVKLAAGGATPLKFTDVTGQGVAFNPYETPGHAEITTTPLARSNIIKNVTQTPKNAVNVITPDGTPHLSYDGGRTILVDGKRVEPPTGSYIGSVSGGAHEVGLSVSKPTQTKLQQDIVQNQIKLSHLDQLARDYKSSYLTYAGAAEATMGHVLSKAGFSLSKGLKNATAGRRKFIQGIGQIFNQYRHDITGAQAALQEISMLRKTMLNKNLSPAEFEAAFQQYRDTLERINAIEMRVLKEGLTPGTKPFGQRVDELFASRTTPGSPQTSYVYDPDTGELVAK